MACLKAEKKKVNLKEPITVVLDDLDHSWTKDEIEYAEKMWRSGFSIDYMARRLRPHDKSEDSVDETALLIMHLKREGKIGVRSGGYEGFNDIYEEVNR